MVLCLLDTIQVNTGKYRKTQVHTDKHRKMQITQITQTTQICRMKLIRTVPGRTVTASRQCRMERWMEKNARGSSKENLRRGLTCLTLFWMLFIFMMSSAGKDESSSQSGAVCDILCKCFVEGYEKMSPEDQIRMQGKISYPVRKGAHLSEYAILGALMTLTAASWRREEEAESRCGWQSPADNAGPQSRGGQSMQTARKSISIMRILPVLAAGFLYAVSDEIHQTFVPGRSGEVGDVLIDTFGVLIGVCMVCIFFLYGKGKNGEQELYR